MSALKPHAMYNWYDIHLVPAMLSLSTLVIQLSRALQRDMAWI